jgi:hypothetical protein
MLNRIRAAVAAATNPPVVTEDDENVYVRLPLTEDEYKVVLDYRRWRSMQLLLADEQAQVNAAHEQKLAGGGCGGCPSQGGCSEAEPEVGDSSL